MKPRVWISEIEFSDGSKIEFSKNDITIFVGPNNSGKSASLKESAGKLRQKTFQGVVVKDISIEIEGNQAELMASMETQSKVVHSANPEPSFLGLGYNIYRPNITTHWSSYKNGLSELFPVFVKTLNTEERLTFANPASNIRLTEEPPTHPIHILQRHDDLEKKFNIYFNQAFDTDIIIHRNAGNNVPLYVGKMPLPKTGEDRVSDGYLVELEKLDLLHQQGDGMRSFVGVMLSAFFLQQSIIFIDEPDAFLHPPQARLLGKMLAKDLATERQMFMSTHSEDFLKGLLESGCPNLKIIRIVRENNINKIRVLNHSDIANIWSDSLLRHSNILNGLFHSKVVICESDSDCRFYSAVHSANHEGTGSIGPDTLFVHCGGKHRMPTVIKALIKLGVAVKVVADFDVLNDINPLKSIFEDLGGDWAITEADWKLVKTSIDSKRPELETLELKTAIDDIFRSITERVIPKVQISSIQKVLKKASPWAHAKEVGKSFIPSGEATNAYTRMEGNLRQVGLHIVEVGELESFVKSIGDHGPKWVNDVMGKDLKSDPELKPAREFVKAMIA